MATYLRDLEAVIDAEIEELQSQLDGEGAGEKYGPERIGKKPGDESEPPKPEEPKFFSLAGKGDENDEDDTPTEQQTIVKKRPRSRAALEVRPLSARIYRLDQLRRWIRDDPDLFYILDITIGNQVKAAEEWQQELARAAQEQQQQLAKAAERRQRIFSIIGGVASLIIGWLLSLVGTPATLFGR